MATALETPSAATANGAYATKAPSSSVSSSYSPAACGSSQHIFAVAARSLEDCVELLMSLKAVMAEEEREEGHDITHSTHGTNGTNGVNSTGHRYTNGHSSSPHGTAGDHQDAPPLATTMLPHAITPCKRSEMYTKPSVLACQGTIGKHVRHLHDHFRLLLETYPPCKVPMETDIDFAISELHRLRAILEQRQETQDRSPSSDQYHPVSSDLLQPVTLHATIDPSYPPVSFQTTFGRELWFCSLHAVHHFAMIKVICGEFGMPVTEGFGLAPSTVKSRQ
ncbi:hypothetical protein BGZ58_003905 [Dissophora ornata]|nr:hypothetical protein BGZ58_003905 [Dissophora ornata]